MSELLTRMRAGLAARHYSRRTEEAYCHWVRRYVRFHRLPPSPSGAGGVPPQRHAAVPKFLPQLTRGSARRETTGAGHGRRLSQVNVIKGNGR